MLNHVLAARSSFSPAAVRPVLVPVARPELPRGKLLDGRLDVVPAQVSIALHHDLSLPSAGPLGGVALSRRMRMVPAAKSRPPTEGL